MLRAISRSSLALIAAGLALALAACSSDATRAPGPNGPTVVSLIRSMKSGFANASSVRVSGTGTFNGTPLTLDLGMFRSGNITGHVIERTLNVNVIGVSGTFYYYVSKTFFNYLHMRGQVPLSECKKLCGKYIPVSNPSLSRFSLGYVVRRIETRLPVPTSAPHIRATTYHGQPAYELYDNQGHEVFIAEHGVHYLLALVYPGQFMLTFSEWNAVPPVTAPPASKIFTG